MREFWPLELCANADQNNTSLVVRIAAGGADSILINGCLWVAEG
jgi:beta-lactamase superfamily II metal-dependent hydrolase